MRNAMSDHPSHALRVPQLTARTRAGLKDYWSVLEQHHVEVDAKVLEVAVLMPDFAPIVKALSADKAALEKQNRESRERSRRAFLEDQWEPFLKDLNVQGERYAKMGVSYASWLELVRRYAEFMPPYMQQAYGKDPERLQQALASMHEMLYLTVEGIGEAYLNTKESVIRSQEEAIRELSTPVLQIRDRLLIVPVIGIVDTQRARQVTEAMLKAIRDRRARAVVVDITGVPMVDSKVANHLVQSVEAARLMGTTVIITGLSPEIAQTLVTLGADLPNVLTFGDLQTGLEEADAIIRAKQTPKPTTAEA
jgi:rsbT co-antagonist protein RsbR